MASRVTRVGTIYLLEWTPVIVPVSYCLCNCLHANGRMRIFRLCQMEKSRERAVKLGLQLGRVMYAQPVFNRVGVNKV